MATTTARQPGPRVPVGRYLPVFLLPTLVFSIGPAPEPTSATRCTWLHLEGAESAPQLMGLYQRSDNQSGGRDTWIQGSIDAHIVWTGTEWVVASEGIYYFATADQLNDTGAVTDISDPILFNGTWSKVVNSSISMPEGMARVPEPSLVLGCLATEDEFTMNFEVRELWTFGFNFYGELARGQNVLTMESNPSPQRVTSRFGSQILDDVAAGCNHGLAVSTDGKLWAWGSNTLGQLGQTRGLGQSNAHPTPELVSGGATFTSAVAGGTFSVATSSDGQVWSVGGNRFGQLGRPENAGEETWTSALGRVTGLPGGVVQLAAGKHHCMALTSGGEVYSWGSNLYGQLGTPRNADSEAANSAPARIAMNETVAGIAAGRFHSLLLAAGGEVWTFGSNLRGQVGPEVEGRRLAPGSRRANAAPTQMPPALFGGAPVVGVAAGQFFSLAQTAGGEVWGFGRNYFGQLSSAAPGVGLSVPVAVPVCVTCAWGREAGAVTGMRGGADHTVLVVEGARGETSLLGLGSNQHGQLGTTAALGSGSAEAVEVAGAVTACSAALSSGRGAGPQGCLTGGSRVVEVAAECEQTLVLAQRPDCPPGSRSASAGGLGVQPCAACAAGSFQGAAGQTGCAACPQSSVSFAGSSRCLACPPMHNTSGPGTPVGGCAPLCPAGTFGARQAVGALGLSPCEACPRDTFADENGTAECKPCPPYTGSVETGLRSEAGCREFCAAGSFSDDGLEPCRRCPGGTYSAHRRNTSCAVCPPGSSSAPGSTACTLCAAGSFAARENSSECGLCSYGTFQPGEGATACEQCSSFKSAPILGATNESECLPTVWQIWGAGNNMWGQLGSGFSWNVTDEVNFEAVQVASDPDQPRRGLDNEDVLQASAGFSHSLFVTVHRRLFAAGHNDYGQLGFPPASAPPCLYADAPDLTCRFNPAANAVPTEVDPGRFNRTVVLAKAGRHFSVVVTDDGRLWSLGLNSYGQLGRREKLGEDTEGDWVAREVMPDVVDVAAGWYHVLVVASNGALMAFGLNRFGQLGVEQNQGTWRPNPDPVLIHSDSFGGGSVAAIAAGGSFSMVLTTEGEVWTFGSNHKGQLGVPEQFGVWGGSVWQPQMVQAVWMQAAGEVSVSAIRIAAGAKHAVVQSSDGLLWGIGNNLYGQLGSVSLIGDETHTPYRMGLDLPTFGLDDTPFKAASEVVAIACGSDHTMLQTADFRLWLLGSNRFGQLLRADNAGEWEFNPEPRAVVPCDLFDDQEVCEGYIVANFSAGAEHTLIITGSRSCPPGSKGPPPFGRPGQLGDCQTCPMGTASAGSGSTACTACAAGWFAPAGAEACSECPEDSFASGSGNGECTPCPTGERTQSAGSASAGDCRATCGPGRYSLGTVIGGEGVEPCADCPAGTLSAAAGARGCTACQRGEWAAAGATECTACAAGESTAPGAGEAAADCTPVCAAGTRSATGLAPCEACPQGSTSPAEATTCFGCAAGQDTSGNGSTACTPVCFAGTFGAVNPGLEPCAPCAAGSFAPARATACEACPPGNFSAQAGAAACVPCRPGSFARLASQSACEECVPGEAQPAAGQTQCAPCPRGTYSDAAAAEACLPCPAGETSGLGEGSTGCVPCAAGTAFDAASALCELCPAGSFAGPRAPRCEPCPVGSFGAQRGASACEACAFGTTATDGRTSAAECMGLTATSLAVARADGLPRAGGVARLSLRLTPLMNVEGGERIVLGLPAFTRSAAGREVELGGSGAAAVAGEWQNATEELPVNALILTVRPGAGVDRLNAFELEVPEAAGVALPQLGITTRSPPITLSTDAAAGAVPPTEIEQRPAVGSFGASSTAIWDGAHLSIAAMPMMQLREGDSLLVHLPVMLRSQSGPILPLVYLRRLAGLFGVNGTWSAVDNVLQLTIPPGQPNDPAVEAESTVAVMVGGLELRPGPWHNRALTISSDAVAGPVPETTVQRVCKQEPGALTVCCSGASPSCLYL